MYEFCQSDLVLHFLSSVIQYCHAAIHLSEHIARQRAEQQQGGDASRPSSAKPTTNEEGLLNQLEDSITSLAVQYGKLLLYCR